MNFIENQESYNSKKENSVKSIIEYNCLFLFPLVHKYLIESETKNLRLITGDESTTLDSYPYFYDKEDILEFSHGRCQDSSTILGYLLFQQFEGQKKNKSLEIKILGQMYYLSYMVFGQDEHAFLRISNGSDQILIDPSYKQFAAVISTPTSKTFFASCEENERLKRALSVYVGRPEEITSYFKLQLPKTGRSIEDCTRILTYWIKGEEKNDCLISFLKNKGVQ